MTDGSGVSDQSDMSVVQAAGYLGVSDRTVRRYIAGGKISARLVLGPYGEEYRLAAGDVEAFRATREQRTQRGASLPAPRTSAPVQAVRGQEGAILALVEPLREELAGAREQIERLARENGELRERLRQLETRSPPADRPDRRPWWRLFLR